VYVLFKDFGLISYDPAGKLGWRVALGPFVNTVGLGASPILAGDSIVLVADQLRDSVAAAVRRRLVFCQERGHSDGTDPATGSVLKTGRVESALGRYSAPPVTADGKVFLVYEQGKVAVLRAGRDWDVLVVNDLAEARSPLPLFRKAESMYEPSNR
jgi:hypothetical protein